MCGKGWSPPKYLELKEDVEYAGRGAGPMAQWVRELALQAYDLSWAWLCTPPFSLCNPNAMGG